MQDLQQDNSANVHPQGYILCGGQSRRFGSDKARHEIEGTPLISRIATSLKKWTNHITAIAAEPDKYQDLQLETIADLHPGLGPLGGLETALTHAKKQSTNPWIILVSCDMTTLSTSWIDLLWEKAQSSSQYQAVLFKETATRLHPFPGCFHIDLLNQIEKQISANKLSLQNLFHAMNHHMASLQLPDNWPQVPQINTKEDAGNWQPGK